KTHYSPHKLIAKVHSESNQLNLLFHQRYSANTTSTLAYQPPAPTKAELEKDPKSDFNPADRELDFWINTKTTQTGNNFTSFLLSLIPKLPLGKEAENPQNNFIGSNKGTKVTTEVEFTSWREGTPQTSFE